ncbi:MAG: hypothetical protein RI973_2209 [Bacteroidota bacterium]|jgi:hypothetical protein
MKTLFFPAALLLLLPSTPRLSAQPAAQEAYLNDSIQLHAFDAGEWKSLTSDMNYGKKEKRKETGQPAEGIGPALPKLGTILKVLAVLGMLGLLAFLFFRLANGEDLLSPNNRKLPAANAMPGLDHIEENLESTDLEDPIRQAVGSENYALAIRLHYLAILKELSQKNYIHWKREKTNGEYLQELGGSQLLLPVRQATLIFERVWYGKTSIGPFEYVPLAEQLVQVLAHIRKNGVAENHEAVKKTSE